jgi:hypothetical protein
MATKKRKQKPVPPRKAKGKAKVGKGRSSGSKKGKGGGGVLMRPPKSTHEILSRLGKDPLLVSVSTGKDSVAMLHAILACGLECKVVHRYWAPGLEFEEEVLTALERKLGVKITRLEEPRVSAMHRSDTLCINKVWNAEDGGQPDLNKFDNFILSLHEAKWLALGCRITDGPIRAMTLSKYPNPYAKTRKVYPIAHWKKKDVWDYIKANKLPISKTYEWFGRSMDCVNVKHVYPLKIFAPKDYEKILDVFPLLEPLIWLYEKRIERYGHQAVPEC